MTAEQKEREREANRERRRQRITGMSPEERANFRVKANQQAKRRKEKMSENERERERERKRKKEALRRRRKRMVARGEAVDDTASTTSSNMESTSLAGPATPVPPTHTVPVSALDFGHHTHLHDHRVLPPSLVGLSSSLVAPLPPEMSSVGTIPTSVPLDLDDEPEPKHKQMDKPPISRRTDLPHLDLDLDKSSDEELEDQFVSRWRRERSGWGRVRLVLGLICYKGEGRCHR